MKANTNSLTYISENFNIGDYEFDGEYSYDHYKFRDSGAAVLNQLGKKIK